MSPIVLDASVFVAAFQSGESDHATSLQVVSRLSGTLVACPTLVLPECAGAIARVTGRKELADEVSSAILDCSGLSLCQLDEPLAREATALASSLKLRGSDAVYVAVAARLDATLVTLDREVLQRARVVIRVLTPSEWLAEQESVPG